MILSCYAIIKYNIFVTDLENGNFGNKMEIKKNAEYCYLNGDNFDIYFTF